MESQPKRRRRAFPTTAVCLSMGLAIAAVNYLCSRSWATLLTFDDAYMFTRYAQNLRAGLGISWNPGGPPTFGLTSIPWVFFVLPATCVLSSQNALQISSGIAGGFSIGLMILCVQQNAASKWLSNPFGPAILLAVSVGTSAAFRFQLTSGMDTMLAVGANALLLIAVLAWQRLGTMTAAIAVGLVALFAIVVRLDNGLCALLIPLLTWSTKPTFRKPKQLLALIGIPVIGTCVFLLGSYFYFGTALPLSFYAKSVHRYDGFMNPESPVEYLAPFASAFAIPFVLAALLATWTDARRLWPIFLPIALSMSYLLGVKQIMGGYGRFYFPLLPFIMVPSVLILDRFLIHLNTRQALQSIARGLIPKLAIVAVLYFGTARLDHLRRIALRPLPVPTLSHRADKDLATLGWFYMIESVSDLAEKSFNGGGIIAASEVGYLGERLPKTKIIDLAGLNDTRIGKDGFSMDYVLSLKPDLIWFPHSDYTGLNAAILTDKRLFDQYEVIAGAFNYGIAIRKNGHYRRALCKNLEAMWPKLYPDSELESYVSTSPKLELRGSRVAARP